MNSVRAGTVLADRDRALATRPDITEALNYSNPCSSRCIVNASGFGMENIQAVVSMYSELGDLAMNST